MMNTLRWIALLLMLLPATVRSQTAGKVEGMVKALMPAGWSLTSDHTRIISSASGIRLLNPISLPASSSSDELWKEFSWESDFHVVIRITPRIDDAEYAKMVKLREEIMERRVREWEKKQGRPLDGKTRLGIEWEVQAIADLPYCHDEKNSFWISTTDQERFLTRPQSARDFSDAVKRALAKQFVLHKREPER